MQERGDGRGEVFRLFLERAMAAALEDDEPRAGNATRQFLAAADRRLRVKAPDADQGRSPYPVQAPAVVEPPGDARPTVAQGRRTLVVPRLDPQRRDARRIDVGGARDEVGVALVGGQVAPAPLELCAPPDTTPEV